MQENQRVRLSKRMSKVLRHAPGSVGLTLDAHGWVAVDDLLAALSSHGPPVTRAMLDEVVRLNDKRRFAVDETGTRIRASQGHSVEVDLQLTPVQAPALLFHGTVEHSLRSIRNEGLRPMRRHHVHLSGDRATAARVGARRGKPVVLEIDAAAMTSDGYVFFRSDNGVWLTASVPPRYLRIPH
jgi:putative RNA 2'-phosphotransferase